jgi:glycosyltransferase involved in cell wall biosynthesis
MHRVLHVSQPTEAGVARVVRHLVTDQLRAGWDVITACPPTGSLPVEAAAAGARVLAWPASREPGPISGHETLRLRRLVESVGADVVHLHSAKAGLAGRLAIRGRQPTVYQPHAWSFWASTGWQRSAALAWERYGARWTDRLVCVSEREKEEAARLRIPAAGVVVPNSVDVEWFAAQDGRARVGARADLGLGDAPTVVCVGRLCRQKGQDLLLRAWPQVTAAVPAARLVLVGDGPDQAVLAADAPPGVLLAGRTDDPRPWYAAADVVVLPSRWEGLALVLLEAMASARSVVSTDAGGAREALPADAGAVVPVGDTAGLAAALVARLRDPGLATAEGAIGRARACAVHDVRRSTAHIRAIYQDVARAGR